MMRRLARLAAIFLVLVLAASGDGAGESHGGYLDAARAVDSSTFLPAPPAPGSAAFAEDKYAFEITRALKGGERWLLAAQDDKSDPDSLAADFSCALGFALDRKHAPHFFALIGKAGADIGYMAGSGKKFFARLRPLVGNDAPVCVERGDIAKSYSYPSGHSTQGWTYALILAELVPDRAGEIAARGRAYGESRVVCGVHWASDVAAGHVAASVLVAALHGSKDFRADMDKARKEIASLRKTATRPDPKLCSVANAAAANQPW
jgi:acid phosphatase (class A)